MRGSARIGALSLGIVALAAPLAVSCLDRELKPLNPCVVSGVSTEVRATNIEAVDVLFMVDDSHSMEQEQESLAEEFPRLAGVLASGDLQYDPSTGTGDGDQDFPPVKSLRVGVVSSELPIGNDQVNSCTDEPDDGILIEQPRAATDPGCMASYSPAWLQFDAPDEGEPDPAEVDAFAQSFACVGRLGTGGCGFEQQLESVLKALTPRNAEVIGDPDADPEKIAPFVRGSGHGDGANDGFLRSDSLLALILVTDEDDCSAHELGMFDPGNASYVPEINLRCHEHKEALFPVERYVKGFLALRDNPQLLVYAAITGVPPDLVENPRDLDYGAVLDDPRMQEQVDPDSGEELLPACRVDGRGKAYPARRITEVARRLEQEDSHGIVQSICQQNFTGALDAIIGKIAEALEGPCLPRELNPDAQGRVHCNVVETLPQDGDFSRCEDLAPLGRNPDPVRVEDGREVCEIQQIPRCTGASDGECVAPGAVPGEPGWYYDDFSTKVADDCPQDKRQRIAFTRGSEPKTGALVRLECLQQLQGADAEEVTVGAPCASDADCAGAQGFDGLLCVEPERSCQLPCRSDADCLAQNLGGYVCDTGQQAGPWTHDGEPIGICVNPTCGRTDGEPGS